MRGFSGRSGRSELQNGGMGHFYLCSSGFGLIMRAGGAQAEAGNRDPNHIDGFYQVLLDTICVDDEFEFVCNSGCCGLFRRKPEGWLVWMFAVGRWASAFMESNRARRAGISHIAQWRTGR
jgi:hypothetical protein